MPKEGPQVLFAFVPLMIAVGIILYLQWRVRRMAVRHNELGKAALPLFPWPFALIYKRKASPEFQREYAPFIRKSLIVTWVLVGLFIVLMLRSAY